MAKIDVNQMEDLYSKLHDNYLPHVVVEQLQLFFGMSKKKAEKTARFFEEQGWVRWENGRMKKIKETKHTKLKLEDLDDLQKTDGCNTTTTGEE